MSGMTQLRNFALSSPLLLAGLVLPACSNSVDADWLPIGDPTKDGTAYYSPKTVVHNAALTTVWTKVVQASAGKETGAFVLSQMELNCKTRAARNLFNVFHEASGTEQRNPVNGAEASPIVPGTAFYGVAVKLCSANSLWGSWQT